MESQGPQYQKESLECLDKTDRVTLRSSSLEEDLHDGKPEVLYQAYRVLTDENTGNTLFRYYESSGGNAAIVHATKFTQLLHFNNAGKPDATSQVCILAKNQLHTLGYLKDPALMNGNHVQLAGATLYCIADQSVYYITDAVNPDQVFATLKSDPQQQSVAIEYTKGICCGFKALVVAFALKKFTDLVKVYPASPPSSPNPTPGTSTATGSSMPSTSVPVARA